MLWSEPGDSTGYHGINVAKAAVRVAPVSVELLTLPHTGEAGRKTKKMFLYESGHIRTVISCQIHVLNTVSAEIGRVKIRRYRRHSDRSLT